MDANSIQNFLNQFPNSCLKNYASSLPDADPYKAYSNYAGTATAAQIIKRVADVWGVNPKVILAKLQQEESLVKGDAGCSAWRYNSAMGYKCEDSSPCDPRYAGFTQQVTKGTWQLKFNKEASLNNNDWQGNGDVPYGGFMTEGNRRRCATCTNVDYGGIAYRTLIYYDGYTTLDSTNIVHMDTGATASLYSYTPHYPSSFPSIFEALFGVGSTSMYPVSSVFRLYNPQNNEHFLTSSPAEKYLLQAIGFRFEGLAYYSQMNGSGTPLYRLYNSRVQKHFYTTSAAERDYAVTRLGFIYERVDHYVDTTPGIKSVAVYRLSHAGTSDHLYTTSAAERDFATSRLGYIYEGIAWYVE